MGLCLHGAGKAAVKGGYSELTVFKVSHPDGRKSWNQPSRAKGAGGISRCIVTSKNGAEVLATCPS